MGKVAPGIGIRHFNDNTGTLVITLLLGLLGVQALAAATVATKIWSLFCRIPQACVSATFVFYAYGLGRASHEESMEKMSRTLIKYAAVPTFVCAVLVAVGAPWIVGWFSDGGQDQELTRYLLYAFLLTLPVYLIENHYGEILTALQRGGTLAIASSVTTYAVAIPLAALATFWYDSAFLVVLSSAVPSAILGGLFFITVRRHHLGRQEVKHVENSGIPA
jgi:Na+-driven multidrug efflux pump